MTTMATESITQSTLKERREEIEKFLEGEAVRDQIEKTRREESQLRLRLGRTMSETSIEVAMGIRQACRHYLITAMATSERVFVRDRCVR